MVVCFIICLVLLVLPLRRTKQSIIDYGNKDWFDYLRCFFAIMVVFHHMVKYTDISGAAYVMFENLGFLSVAVFFMISGYGLSFKYRNGYVKGYASNKVVGIVLEYLLVMALYALWEVLSTGSIDMQRAVTDMKGGILYVDNSWYIAAILIIYLVFDLVQRFCASNTIYPIILMSLFGAVYTAVLIVLRWGGYWYVSYWAFILGMSLSIYKERITELCSRKYCLILTAAIVGFISAFSGSIVISAWLLRTILKMVSAVLLALITCLIGMKVRCREYRPVKVISTISLEVYLLHGLSFRLLRNQFLYIQNEFAFAPLTVLLCLLMAYITFKIVYRMKSKTAVNQ